VISVPAPRQPDDHVHAERAAQLRLDLLAAHPRVAVRVQQALLGRDQRALAVDQERAALKDERGGERAHPEVRGDPVGQVGVVVVRVPAAAPGVEPEVDHRDLPGVVADEDRAAVAHPGVVDRDGERLDPRSAQVADLGLVARVADHRERLETGDRAGDPGVVGLRVVEPVQPQLTPSGPGHQAARVRSPLRGHRESGGSGALALVERHAGSSSCGLRQWEHTILDVNQEVSKPASIKRRVGQRARIWLFRASWVTSARPSVSSSGGR